MIILTLRTDKPEAELGIYEDEKRLRYVKWQAHRELAETIHKKIDTELEKLGKSWNGVEGIVSFKGPGSFTGLRIGLTVANALAYALDIPVVAATGEDWLEKGIQKIKSGKSDKVAIPNYGKEANVTKPRK